MKNLIISIIVCFMFISTQTNFLAYELNTEVYAEVPASESANGIDTCIIVTSDGMNDFLSLINQERALYGIAPLQTNDYWQHQAMARVGDDLENYVRGESPRMSHITEKYYGQSGESLATTVFDYNATDAYYSYYSEKQYVPEGLVEGMAEGEDISVDTFEGDPAVGDTIFAGIGGKQIGHYLAMVDPFNTYVGNAGGFIDSWCNGYKDDDTFVFATLYSDAAQGYTNDSNYVDYATDMANGSRIDGVDESKLVYDSIDDPACAGVQTDWCRDYVISWEEQHGTDYETSNFDSSYPVETYSGTSKTTSSNTEANTTNESIAVNDTNTKSNTSSKNKETNSKEQKTKKEKDKKKAQAKKEAEEKKKAEDKVAAELKETTMARTEGIDTLVSTREDRFSNIISLLIIFTILYWSVATMYLIIKTS